MAVEESQETQPNAPTPASIQPTGAQYPIEVTGRLEPHEIAPPQKGSAFIPAVEMEEETTSPAEDRKLEAELMASWTLPPDENWVFPPQKQV